MQSGQLRHPITILAQSTTQDGFGQVGDPVAFSTTWASIDQLVGKELFQAQQRVAEVTHKVTVRYQPNIKANMFVDYNGRVFTVEAVLNWKEKNVYLELLCVERNDSAETESPLLLLSGVISGAGGTGATVTISGPTNVTVTADTDGNYQAFILDGTYTVTPAKVGHTFTPLNQTVVVADQEVEDVDFITAS